ncbi:MAG: adenylate/guanylate cyclase domain-containing protein [Leptolyngbyaceae cyanobacterium RU_5_1]|nr:adenylate/guanylate cyclase domain-containing protein [Leptolyngbyaceae cyanobacterium RU_5_1]
MLYREELIFSQSVVTTTTQPTPHLLLRTDSGYRRLLLTGGNCWTIGRSEDNNFVLPDRWISRNHAMLQYMESGEFYLIDLGSRNGSFVNSRRVSIPVTLHNGDRLTFGQTELEFYCPPINHGDNDNDDNSSGFESKEFTATATLHVRRLISVLVVDIRNFTVLTRQLDEKILSEMIGTWFRHAGDIIREYGSWVDKYIGDAVMAVWIHGAEETDSDEMLKILQALDAMHKMTSDLYNLYPLPFPLRIGAGINTGYAMVGNTGSGDRPDYTALGDTVNAAFRLETSTKQIGKDVAVGKTTFQYLSSLGADSTVFGQYTVNLRGYDAPALAYACSFDDLDAFLQQKKMGSS